VRRSRNELTACWRNAGHPVGREPEDIRQPGPGHNEVITALAAFRWQYLRCEVASGLINEYAQAA
jgi:hypothetical protein